MKYRHSCLPYYAYSQRLARRGNRFHNQNTSSLEFWRWFDDKCGPNQRAWINYGLTGDDVLSRCKRVIIAQGGLG